MLPPPRGLFLLQARQTNQRIGIDIINDINYIAHMRRKVLLDTLLITNICKILSKCKAFDIIWYHKPCCRHCQAHQFLMLQFYRRYLDHNHGLYIISNTNTNWHYFWSKSECLLLTILTILSLFSFGDTAFIFSASLCKYKINLANCFDWLIVCLYLAYKQGKL